eukprot:6210461-Pleurochrysis_carterae.AAC.2
MVANCTTSSCARGREWSISLLQCAHAPVRRTFLTAPRTPARCSTYLLTGTGLLHCSLVSSVSGVTKFWCDSEPLQTLNKVYGICQLLHLPQPVVVVQIRAHGQRQLLSVCASSLEQVARSSLVC